MAVASTPATNAAVRMHEKLKDPYNSPASQPANTILFTESYKNVVKAADIRPYDFVLDAACGGGKMGNIAGHFLAHGGLAQVWWVDADQGMVEEAIRLK